MKTYDKLQKTKLETIISDVDTMIWYLHKKIIIPAKNGKNVIEVLVDNSCQMAMIRLNSKCMMEGNFHDFHPGCHGGDLRVLGYLMGNPNWNGYSSLVRLIEDYINRKAGALDGSGLSSAATVEIKTYSAKYTNSGKWIKRTLTEIIKN